MLEKALKDAAELFIPSLMQNSYNSQGKNKNVHITQLKY